MYVFGIWECGLKVRVSRKLNCWFCQRGVHYDGVVRWDQLISQVKAEGHANDILNALSGVGENQPSEITKPEGGKCREKDERRLAYLDGS